MFPKNGKTILNDRFNIISDLVIYIFVKSFLRTINVNNNI